jgi:hypothetical protein
MENMKGSDDFQDTCVDERIILKCILEKFSRRKWNGFGSAYGSVTGSCEHGNEPSGSIEDRRVFE